jgi:hypothetical protein
MKMERLLFHEIWNKDLFCSSNQRFDKKGPRESGREYRQSMKYQSQLTESAS